MAETRKGGRPRLRAQLGAASRQSLDVMLLDAAGLVDEALEDAANGVGVERGLGGAAQALEQGALALGIVDRHVALALVLAHLDYEPDSLVQ
jgi:hypothetical protein